MINADKTYKILHSPFDVETHKKSFIEYLEVIILPDGSIEYAVPSHVMWLMEYTKRIENINDEQLREIFMTDQSGLTTIEWLINRTKCLSVHTHFYYGEPNEKQQKTIDMLNDNGFDITKG